MAQFISFVIAFVSLIQTSIADDLPNHNLGCFADLGPLSNRKPDVILYDEETVTALMQNTVDDKTKDFEVYAQFSTAGKVQSVSAFDVHGDGIAGLFVVSKPDASDDKFDLTIWKDQEVSPPTGVSGQFVQEKIDTIKLSSKDILVLDANGDFKPDVLGRRDGDDQRIGIWFGPKFTKFQPLTGVANHESIIDLETASFIDLDQDCRADLVYMTTDKKEIKMLAGEDWEKSGAESPSTLIKLDASWNVQNRIYFADINKDGAMDIIIPSTGLDVHFFIQKENFGFKELCMTERKKLDTSSFEHITMQLTVEEEGYSMTSISTDNDLPFIIQDIDLDLNLEIIAVLNKPDSSWMAGRHKYHPEVFVGTLSELKDNQPIPQSETNKKVQGALRSLGGIAGQHPGTSTIEDLAFFHSGEFPFGLHLMLKTATEWKWLDMEQFLSNTNHGFLSICPLNDASTSQKRYGGAMPGAMIKAFFRSRNGDHIFLTAGTFYQTNSRNHLLPFTVFGLGNPDSYIEKLVIAYSFYDQGDGYVLSQPGVPPNSQLVLFAHPRDQNGRWRLETFLAPYIKPLTLALIITAVLLLLGGFWLYLEIKQRKAGTKDELKAGATTTNNFFF